MFPRRDRAAGRTGEEAALSATFPEFAQDAWRMPDAALDRMFELVREVGCAELKFTVADTFEETVRTAIGPGPTRIRHVYFLDTADLTLRHHGVLARVRGGQSHNDSVVKLRPLVPAAVPAVTRHFEDFAVEVDVTPDSFICSGALRRRLTPQAVDRAVAGERTLKTLFSEQQLALLAARLPEPVAVEDLLPLGPVEVRRTRALHRGVPGRGLALQRWRYPDGSVLLELSTRCDAENLLETAGHVMGLFDRHGITLAGPCPTKADMTLSYFTRG